jgi:hypothetical protein
VKTNDWICFPELGIVRCMSRVVIILLALLTVGIAGMLVLPRFRESNPGAPSREFASEAAAPGTTITAPKHSHSVQNGIVTLEVGGVQLVLPLGWELLDQPINFFVQERARNVERGIAVSAGAFPMELSLEKYVGLGLIGMNAETGKQFEEFARILGIPVTELEQAARSRMGREYLEELKKSLSIMEFQLIRAEKIEIAGKPGFEIHSQAKMLSSGRTIFSRQFTLEGAGKNQIVQINLAGPTDALFQDETILAAIRRKP